MYFTEYGSRDLPTVVLLHGAFFVDSFGRQYPLSSRYHLVVPHIPGFGKAADETFETDKALGELKELISQFDAPVYLVGFSLGAQLAVRLIADAPEMVKKAIVISPLLMNKDRASGPLIEQNLKMLRSMKNKLNCKMIGLMNGMPKRSRAEFVESMQRVSEETVRNCVDNGISFESAAGFAGCGVPVLALAGEKEPEDIKNSVKQMSELNPLCTCEIWDKAAHNIPPVFAKRFNETMLSYFRNE
ncbi:MAG: alpha/beta hydrolase [Oscillospiraceae bacterium]|nr:alpha/beta hydrolase [Oscillospiraceae bacterium]